MTTSTINNSSASSGLVINIKDQKGQPIQYTYNSKGELTKITYADQSFETFTYDQSGNLTEAVERSGDTFNYTYDSTGRVIRKAFDDGTFQDYTYDHKGNLTSIKDVNNEVTIIEYDADDRLTKITYPEGRFLEYSYDSKDRRTQIKDHNGFAVNYSYDNEDRLTKLTDGNGENIISYDYDSEDRLSKETNGNETYTTYGYDDDGQVTSIINYIKSGAVNSSFDYTYDESGQQTGVTTNDGTWTYEYDAKGQLIKALFTSTNHEIADQNLQYVYDAVGNRTQTIVNGVTTNYTANNLNQYTTVGDATYSYDADGNLISIVDGIQTWTYEYNDENRLIGGTTPEGIFSYEYDALGNRIATVHNGERTEYLIDPFALGDVFGEYNGSGELVANYVYGNGLVGRFEGNNSAYYDSDYIGSTVGITDASGNYINRYLYQPFGQEILKTETLANPFEFVGQWGVMDEANGLDFMRARFYSSSDGRFISSDPIGIAGGINTYAYSLNDPIEYIDPEGTLAFLAPLAIPALATIGRIATGAAVNVGLYHYFTPEEERTTGGYVGSAVTGSFGGISFLSKGTLWDKARNGMIAFLAGKKTEEIVERYRIESDTDERIYEKVYGSSNEFLFDFLSSGISPFIPNLPVGSVVNKIVKGVAKKEIKEFFDDESETNDTLWQDITLIEDGYITSLSDANGELIAESAFTYGSSLEGFLSSASFSQYLENGSKFEFDNNIEILDNSDSAYLSYSESGGFTINFSDQNDQGEDVPTGSLEFDWNNIEIVDNLISVTPDSDYDINISRKNADGEIVEQYSGTQDSARGILDLNGGAVDANGNPIGEWETVIVGVAPESGATVSKTAKTNPNGEVISPWETSIEFTEEYAQFIINEAYRNTEEAIIGNRIGELFGSSLGQAIAGDNVFAQIGSQTALSTVLGNIGQSVGISLRNGFDLLDGVEKAFEDFSQDLFKNLQSNSLSAVSSFLTAELSDALDIPSDFGGQLLESYLGSEVSNIANAVIGVDLTPWNPGAFLGGYLARQVVSPETAAGAIAGSIGGAIGASIGTGIAYGGSTIIGSFSSGLVTTGSLSTVFGSASPLLGIPIVAAFAFAATAIGTILGDKIYDGLEGWFDDHGYGNAYANISSGASSFVEGEAIGKDGDFIKSARDVRDATLQTINAILTATGSENAGNDTIQLHVRHQKQKSGFLGTNTKHYYWYKIYSTDETGNETELYGQSSLHKWNAQQWVDALTINTLKNMNLAGGNLYMQRAVQNSQAKTVEELFGDLQIASDYYQYLQNKDIIDLLIAMEPNSAFSAGWVITLIRAEELGLTEWSASDFAGGLPSFLDSFGLDDIVTPDDIDISINGTTLKLEISVDGQIVQTIEIEDFANKIGYQQLAASSDGSAVTGTEGNDIWIAENISSTFIDGTATAKNPSHDILIGSNFADTIDGGEGRDFIKGNSGNDLLIGGTNQDLISGGDGDDTIHADENNGFADIPNDVLSDAASPDAPQGFDGSRRTWFGGTETLENRLSGDYVPATQDFNKDEVHGGAGNDKITGGTGEDQLFGDEGNDTLYGDEGHDYLVGGADADILYGGVGFDVASYEDATQGVTVDLANGTASDGDRLYSIEDVIGSSFNDTLFGDGYSNILNGGMGSDTIDGQEGRDTVSFFNSASGVEINMNTGQAITKTGENSSDTDTLINIEDAIASSHDDTLIGSTLGGGLDGGDGNDTIIIQHDDVDVANGAATYTVRGGEGVDTLSFANWNKSRGVEINLNESENGHSFDSIEKIIGSSFADKITGSQEVEIFDGGAGNDVFTISEGQDVYLLNRGSDNDQIGAIEIQTGLDSRWSLGQIKFSHPDYKELYPFLSNRKVTLGVNYDTLVRYGTFSEEDQTISQEQSLVFGDNISYHDIFGGGITLENIQLKLGKLEDPTLSSSFRDLTFNDQQGDLRLEIYDPNTNALSGSITLINFQSPLSDVHTQSQTYDRLRFAGDLEYNLDELVTQQGLNLINPVQWSENNHLYTLTSSAKTWHEAQAEAVSLGGHLVAVNSEAEQQFLIDTFLSGDDKKVAYWIGLNDAAQEGKFVWTTGEPLTYTNWQSGQPNSWKNQDYVELNWHHKEEQSRPIGTWSDVDPDANYFGIIEIIPTSMNNSSLPNNEIASTAEDLIFNIPENEDNTNTKQFNQNEFNLVTGDNLNLGEVDTITLDHNVQTITLDRSYNNPVIFAPSVSFNGHQLATPRITNVTNNSFDIYLQEPSNKDGLHISETLSYLVIEKGTYQLSDGTLLEVGTLNTNSTATPNNPTLTPWQTVEFNIDFADTPVIFTQVQTDNESDLVRTRQQNPTVNGFEVVMEEDEINARNSEGHLNETIGYIAIASGNGYSNEVTFQAGSTSNSITHAFSNINFDREFNNIPHFFANIATYDGPDSSALRHQNLTVNGVEVAIQEDTTFDSETNHTTEVVNYLAIEGDNGLQGTAYDPLTGNRAIVGTDSNDYLFGLAQNDTRTGKGGSDIFVLEPNQDPDTITDFELGIDLIGLTDGLSFGALTLTDIDNDTSVMFDSQELAILKGIQSTQLTNDHFVEVTV